jgi:hypothetical protein
VRRLTVATAAFLLVMTTACGSTSPKAPVASSVPVSSSPSPATSPASAAAQRSALSRASHDALRAARSDVVILLSYDYRQLDADFAKQEEVVTAGLLTTLKQSLASVRGPALVNHVTLKAEVLKASVAASELTSTRVTAQINQLVHNDLLPAPETKVSTVELTMALVGNTWKISGLKAV